MISYSGENQHITKDNHGAAELRWRWTMGPAGKDTRRIVQSSMLVLTTRQMIFAGVVMAISVAMAKTQKFNDPPVATQYSIFAGVFGLVVGIVGLFSMFFDQIPGTSVLAADGLCGLFLLAAALVMSRALSIVSQVFLIPAVQAFSIDMSGADCTGHKWDLIKFDLINEGRYQTSRGLTYGVIQDGDGSRVFENCRLARANQGLQLATCALALLTMVVTFKLWRVGRVGPPVSR